MSAEGRNTSGLEQLIGKEYATWKDKLLTHINTQDQLYKRKQLEKGLPEVHVLMADFLRGSPERPLSVAEQGRQSEKEKLAMRWVVMDWERAKGDLQNLLNQVLPNFFLCTLTDLVSQMDPCEVIKALEKDCGQGGTAGLIELTRAWSKLAKSQWRDLRTLFGQLKKSRNEINRKSQTLLGQDMVTKAWLCVEVLSQVPSEFWASSIAMKKGEFTVEKVEGALRRIFDEKSKKEISMHMDKSSPIAINSLQVKQGQKRKQKAPDDCFYYHEPGHFKSDCPVMARDRDPNREGGPLFRTDIRTAPGANKKARKAKISAVKTMKAVVKEGEQRLDNEGKTQLEQSLELEDDIDSDDLVFTEDGDIPMSDEGSQDQVDLDKVEKEALVTL